MICINKYISVPFAPKSRKRKRVVANYATYSKPNQLKRWLKSNGVTEEELISCSENLSSHIDLYLEAGYYEDSPTLEVSYYCPKCGKVDVQGTSLPKDFWEVERIITDLIRGSETSDEFRSKCMEVL